ncbi:TraI domain-containing protein [Enterovibrio norvegicus]|uniref:TraI domain-containing protein n=1 Tax=Enterovibrio norvegicus TaxID=188144 RepID=UPI000C81825D|nr:TraI domain-containing protein [Enterovibrio norvegicus]PMH64570.1 hypothetical protein BCU62_16065 [Enterovibrio norvegicus]
MLINYLSSIFLRKKLDSKSVSEQMAESSVQVVERRNDVEQALVSASSNHRFFLDAETILSTEQCGYCVAQIKEIAGLSDEYFDKYYRPVINNFAVLCQDIGASERYHHAHRFGLIEHSLEVAMYAMRKSQGCVYFPDGNVETIQWLERVFMYTVFCAAMLHDGAKVFTNFQWRILNREGKWVPWSPLLHSVPRESELVEYRTTPYQNKNGVNVFKKDTHEKFASNLLLEVLPADGLEWILQYSNEHCAELFIHFIHALSSDYANAADVGECVKVADSKSTEDAVKRYHMNSGSAYVDLSDPNTPLHESYKEVLKDMFSSPEKYHLTCNKVAMGKYSHIERFGDLLFVSMKGTVPIIDKHLKAKNIRVPRGQAVYSMLVDNGVSLAAPSGDTLWWCSFFSENNNNSSSVIAYLVFDVSTFPTHEIPDLREYGVQISIEAKSLVEGSENSDSLKESLAENPEIFFKLFPGGQEEPSVKEQIDSKPQDEEQVSERATEHSTTPPSTQVATGPLIEEIPFDESLLAEMEQQGQPRTSPSKEQPAQNRVKAPSSSSRPQEPIIIKAPQSAGNVTPTDAPNSTQKADTGKKPVQKKRKSRPKGSRLEIGMSKALGLSDGMASPPVSKARPAVVTSPQKKDVEKIKGASVAPAEPDGRSVAEKPVCNIPTSDAATLSDPMPFKEKKIDIIPEPIDIDPVSLDETLQQKLPRVPQLFEINSNSNATDNAELMITTWFPFIADLIEKGLVSVNKPNAGVIHMEHGLFLPIKPFSEVLESNVVERMLAVIADTHFTVKKKNGDTTLSLKLPTGEVLSGVLLSTRSFYVKGKRPELFKGSVLLQG